MDKAKWLDEILSLNDFNNPIIIGQSMGGYIGQVYSQLFPKKIKGFVSIDSAPLQRDYTTSIEIWLLKQMETIYRYWPWKSLLKLGTYNVATSDYGRKLMYDIMMTYDGDKERYSQLVGHGYKIIANAIEANKHYEIKCQHYLYVVKKIMQVLVAFTVVFPSNFLLNTNIMLSTFNIREYTLCLNIARILGKYPF